MTLAISVEDLSKMYRLGVLGTGTLAHDLNRIWSRFRGKDDPALQVGVENNREQLGGDYVWALRDISFDVPQGEILGIIGRNGAGKSTLLKILSRITAPTKGSVKMRGRVASLLEVGTGFHPELTGRENVYLNGAILGMTRSEVTQQLDEIIDFSGCEKYIDTPAKRYSSGMKVRLGFSVAAHLECEILIVDEVLAVGDAEFQRKCIGKMKEVGETGRTILFVSHNMNSVTSICRKALIVAQGSISPIMEPEMAVKEYLEYGTEQNLEARIDRRGSGEIKIANVQVLSVVDNLIRCGDPLEFETSIRNCTTVKRSFFLIFAICTKAGQRVCVQRSADQKQHFEINPEGDLRVKSKIKLPHLSPGEYRIDAMVTGADEVFDGLEIAVSFAVVLEEGKMLHRATRPGEVICQATFAVSTN